jgi:hypothetical protein
MSSGWAGEVQGLAKSSHQITSIENRQFDHQQRQVRVLWITSNGEGVRACDLLKSSTLLIVFFTVHCFIAPTIPPKSLVSRQTTKLK